MVRHVDFGAWRRASPTLLPVRLPLVGLFPVSLILVSLILAFANTARAQDGAQRFSTQVAGEGPDVILIPGLSTPRDVWFPTAEHLQARHRVHLVQVRGFGEAAGVNAQGPILDDLVAELASYIEAQGLEKPAIVGHSLGGLAALMLAVEHPELTDRLLIVDTLPWYGALIATGAEMTMAMVEPQAAQLRDGMIAQYGEQMSTASIEATTANQSLSKEGRAQIAHWIAHADQRVTGQLIYDDITTDMRKDIAQITVPVTVLVPYADPYPTQAIATAFYADEYAALPGVKIKAIGPSRHFIMLDAPAAFMTELDAFLAN